MTNDWYCGIDPGLSGAIAFYNKVTPSIFIFDMPFQQNGSTSNTYHSASHRSEIDIPRLTKIFTHHISTYGKPNLVCLETPHSMPNDGHIAAFRFGKVCGIMDGVLGAMELDVMPLLPAVWKSQLNLSSWKQQSLDKALELFDNIPSAKNYFTLKKHDGRAEAAILAWYGATKFAAVKTGG